MADTTNTQNDAIPPSPPAILSGEELYDSIMGQIEPDLLSKNVDGLNERYASQSPEERTERAQRYRAAFEEYEKRLAQYQQKWNEQLHTYKRLAISYIEHQSQTSEASELEQIESGFDL